MTEEPFHVKLSEERSITAIRSLPITPGAGWLFVYAPRAGSNIHDPFGTYLCRHLAGIGIGAVRFQFPYMESGGRRPDLPQVLEDTWRRVMESVRTPHLKLAIGGRSMGGRIASQVVAQGARVDALALFAYPLRPPGNPSQRRDAHLPAITAPTLFCSGSRDAFATPDELRAAAAAVPRFRAHVMEGADHGFATLKSSGRTREDVWCEARSVFIDWLMDAVRKPPGGCEMGSG